MAPFKLTKHHLQLLTRWLRAQPTPASTPTATVPTIVGRQAPPTVTIFVNRVSYSSGLSGGAIAGIVIGSVVGFILLIWLLWSCFYLGAPRREREVVYADIEPSYHRHRHHRRRRRRSRSSSVSVQPPVSPSAPPPVIIRETSQRPTKYVYKNEEREEFKGGGVQRGRSSRYE